MAQSAAAGEHRHWRGVVTLPSGSVAASWQLLTSGHLVVSVDNEQNESQGDAAASFACQLCKTRIVRKSLHVLKHLNVADMFKCPSCDYQSAISRKSFEQHMRFDHYRPALAPVISREDEHKGQLRARLAQCFAKTVQLFKKRPRRVIDHSPQTLQIKSDNGMRRQFRCTSTEELTSFRDAFAGLIAQNRRSTDGDDDGGGGEEDDEEEVEQQQVEESDDDEEQTGNVDVEDNSGHQRRSASPSPLPARKRARPERDAEEPSPPPLNSTASNHQQTQAERLAKTFDRDWDYCLIACSSDEDRSLIRISEALLIRCSPTLGAMLKRELGEHPVITIEDFSYNDVLAMARFCQTMVLEAGDDTATLLQLSVKYEIGDLQRACTERLLTEMAPVNAVKVLLLADEVKEDALKTAAIDMIVANFAETKTTADYPLLQEKPQLLFQLLERLG